MSAPDAFVLLGLQRSATSEEIRRAWRNKARQLHPDSGGSHARMVELNQALATALAGVQHVSEVRHSYSRRDVSVFTISASLAAAWKSLELVAAECGSVILSESPVSIEFTLHDTSIEGTLHSWCRCDLVPEAGSVTVNVEIGSVGATAPGLLELVRDHLVELLNRLDWAN